MTNSKLSKSQKPILFALDLDDTIIDNYELDYESFRLTAQQFSLQNPTAEQLLEWRLQGLLAKDVIKKLTPDESLVERAFEWRKTIDNDWCTLKYSKIKPGVRAALFTIQKLGYSAVIISRKPEDTIKLLLQMHGLTLFVSKIISAYDKTDVLKSLKALHQESLVFVSDMEDEISIAKTLNIRTYAISSNYQNPQVLQKIVPFIYTLQEIPELKDKPRVIVTGGGGFIGRALCKRLVHDGFSVIATFNTHQKNDIKEVQYVKCDVSRQSEVNTLPFDVSAVFHLAAYLGDDPNLCNTINVKGTKNILEFCKSNKVPRFIFSSSSAVYGVPESLPIKEDAPKKPETPYGKSKLLAEQEIRKHNKDLLCTVFRYGSPYGNGQPDNSVLPLFIKLVQEGKDLLVFNKGARTQEFIYVNDIVTANISALGVNKSETYNIGTGVSTSMKELAMLIITMFGNGQSKIIESDKPETSFNMLLDSSKAIRELSFRYRYTLREGLEEYKKNL